VTFRHDLVWLRDRFSDNEPILLVLNWYSVHRNPETKQCPEDLGTVLKFVPAGMTDALQPLDCSVFGAMKADRRRMDRLHFPYPGSLSLTKQLVSQFLVSASEQVRASVLDAAWQICESDNENWD
jgi:hypothetical protein